MTVEEEDVEQEVEDLLDDLTEYDDLETMLSELEDDEDVDVERDGSVFTDEEE